MNINNSIGGVSAGGSFVNAKLGSDESVEALKHISSLSQLNFNFDGSFVGATNADDMNSNRNRNSNSNGNGNVIGYTDESKINELSSVRKQIVTILAERYSSS